MLRELAEDTARIVTIRGVAGVGKTDLAVVVANRVAAKEPGRVRWVDAEGLAEKEDFLAAVGRAIYVADLSLDSLLQVIRKAGRLLLVVDAFEGLVYQADVLEELVTECPQLRFLVTTKFSLSLSHAIDIELEGLRVPPEHWIGDVKALRRLASARLLLAESKSWNPLGDQVVRRLRRFAECYPAFLSRCCLRPNASGKEYYQKRYSPPFRNDG